MKTRDELAALLLQRADECLSVDVEEGKNPTAAQRENWKSGRELLKAEAEITEKWAQASLSAKQISAALATAREFLGLNARSESTPTAGD